MQQDGASTPTGGKGVHTAPLPLSCISHVLEGYDFLHITLHGTSATTGLIKCH